MNTNNFRSKLLTWVLMIEKKHFDIKITFIFWKIVLYLHASNTYDKFHAHIEKQRIVNGDIFQ